MNRRDLIKSGMLAAGMTAFPGLKSFGSVVTNKSESRGSGFVNIKMDSLDLFIFSDGHITLSNPQPIFAPGIKSDIVKQELRKIYLEENKLEGAINVMLIKSTNRFILIDTGCGHHFGENGGWLHHNLERAGIKATEITDVFITHAHVDHIGGILNKNNEFIYPNAQYYIAHKEYNFWMSPNPDFSKSKDPESPSESIAFVKGVLTAIAPKLTFFDYGDELFSCIRTESAEGHTPGHTVLTIFAGSKSIKHVVDTFHTSLLIARPEWGTLWDIDFEKGVETRKRILEDCYLNRNLVMTTHLSWAGLGYIGKNDNDYHWVSFPYFTPDLIVL